MQSNATNVSDNATTHINTTQIQDTTTTDSSAISYIQVPSEIQVRFVNETTYKDKIEDISYKVPSDLTRLGLSEIVNHLLHTTIPVPFEFLIEYNKKKVFLRTSLKAFFERIQKYPELVITLEYVEAQPAPKNVDTIPHDDWVSCMDQFNSQILFTGCYDGLVRIINPSTGQLVSSTAKHKLPIKGIVCQEDTLFGKESILFVTASMDEQVRIWRYEPEQQKCSLQIALKGHTDAIDCIAMNEKRNLFVTGSQDRSLKIWELNAFQQYVSFGQKEDSSDDSVAAKKQRIQKQSLVGTLQGHHLGISCVHWAKDGHIYSGSEDHTIHIWDVTKNQKVNTLNGSKVPYSIDYNPNLNVVLTAHPDNLIRMWDPRASNAKASLFKSHKGWVRSVQWSPHDNHQFLSGADDNLIKLWDVRSALPLHSVSHHVENDPQLEGKTQEKTTIAKRQVVESHKVLCTHWSRIPDQKEKIFFSGSTDCTVKKHLLS